MANIALNKPSGGQLILSPEDGTSTETVTIPSVGVGKVLQVVNHKFIANTITTSTSYIDVQGSSITFTPRSSASDLIIVAEIHSNTYGPNSAQGLGFVIVHDGAVIDYHGGNYEHYGANQLVTRLTKTSSVSSSTVNPRTIKLQMASYNSGSTAQINSGNQFYSNIIVMEVAA
jgi:hypothetical protein